MSTASRFVGNAAQEINTTVGATSAVSLIEALAVPLTSSVIQLTPRAVGTSIVVELPPALFGSSAQLLKRAIDLVGVLLIGALAFPLLMLIAVAVKLDSKGPVAFGHERIGRGGRPFRAWKFRSMVANSDAVLLQHLQRNPMARAEWKAKQKLRNDPRVTQLGRLLRRTSLDELPQLWNVLIGEMSLVGPRPIIDDERQYYREQIALYEGVLPGLSGLWQVSGRSNTTYDERVQLDSYYVLNWSLWLDVCILVRTIPAALFGRGAC